MSYDSSGNILSTKWDVVLSSPQSGGTIGVAAIELRTTSGGSNLATTSGNASCDATGSNPGNAADANVSTFFTSSGATVRWTYTFASPTQIGEVKVVARNDGSYTQAPTSISAFAYNDNGVTRMVRGNKTGLTWTSGSSNAVALNSNLGTARTFRRMSTAYVNG
jgi:hypothetical protein